MSRSILLTRSKENNTVLREKLIPKGYNCIECSLLKYIDVPFDYSLLNNYSDIIITSKHAAKLIKKAPKRGLSAWVVGNSSAAILEKKGYKIKYIASNIIDLRAQVTDDIYQQVIYLSSSKITLKLPPDIKRHIFYRVSYKKSLSSEQIEWFKQGIDYILLYSENCAKTLIALLLENDLLKYLETALVIVISSKIERVIKDYFKKTMISNSQNEILKYLENYGRKN